MSATEELRRLLDERGVEWSTTKGCDSDSITTVHVDGRFGGTEWEAFELADGTFQVTAGIYDELTPDQFIAATLGRGKLTAEQVRECVQHVYHEGYSDGSVRRGAHIDETDWQAIADELNAALGCGECEDEGGIGANGEQVFSCSECGCVLSLYDSDGANTLCTRFVHDYPRFCPACGRMVKR